ncbi:DUF805 domain-containing protein [Emticicia sp. TH156]|uniref:DUF805 domain-containing protein n=1 Tax=Emticicia sp. TH156 TaxID=2067454 RepID=UPI000C75B816|nr:DUF805 domain-containing protein [Emticicia sp. TH156]PLK45480.1 DUF805 domain-containing protein [Emticicia sp. TH156]
MFKQPFSFEGRIRRTEYGLSIIISTFVLMIIGSIASMLLTASPALGFLIWILALIPLTWFGWAQNAKRCHDLGNSGWFQLIPFYGLWMLFQDSDYGVNQYGLNPKGLGNEESDDEQINEIGKSLEQ